jgi:hypothetical protein
MFFGSIASAFSARARVVERAREQQHGAGTNLRFDIVRQQIGGANEFIQRASCIACLQVGLGELGSNVAALVVGLFGCAVLDDGLVHEAIFHVRIGFGDVLVSILP